MTARKTHCGHPVSSIVSSDEGTNYCRECEAEDQRQTSEMELHRDPVWLKEQYKTHSMAQIAEMAYCSKSTIRRWLIRHGIERRTTSESMKLRWQDEDYRQKVTEAMRAQSPETRAAMMRGCREYWNDPENKRQQSEFMRRMWKNKRYRQAISQSLKVAWKKGAYAFVHYVPEPGSFEMTMWKLRQLRDSADRS